MDARDNNKTLSEIVGLVKSWLPWRSDPATVSRDFWMPDQSCRVCYECDTHFTLINRRHHCRLCGRIFCGKCTANSIHIPSSDLRTPHEEWERIRVCNYCFKQWDQSDGGSQVPNNAELSSSPSATSLPSSKSSTTAHSSSFALGSTPGVIGPSQRVQRNSDGSLHMVSALETNTIRQGTGRNSFIAADVEDPCRFTPNRSDDEFDEYGAYQHDMETRPSPQDNEYYGPVEYGEMGIEDGCKLHLDGEAADMRSLSGSPLIRHCFQSLSSDETEQFQKRDDRDGCDDTYSPADTSEDPVDFENNGLLWVPPDPENEEDESESALFDEDDNEGDASGEWGYLRPSNSFGSGEYRSEDRTSEEHKEAMKNVVDGHFRALIAQLLQVENISVSDEDGKENWLEIITSLSWEAANLLKPDTSKSGGMDPGGYVKVKCLASGSPRESMVVKGVVCKKNVAHRRMRAKIEKPRLLILGSALEYQRIKNQLSSFDTLLQQEKDHLKMAVAKIHAERPNILLVEKSVSRFAQDYLLSKDISLVLNIKRPLLDRIARCTGAQIIPSVDHLSSQKLGHCENFRVERFLEEHGSAGQGGKKLVKTLMYFEGCPKPLGFTILLRGANGDELKKVKHVVQYGVFAAYHLALETSFLADEGASPDLPLNSPITVALPAKSTTIERSISTVPGFTVSTVEKSKTVLSGVEPQRTNSLPTSGPISSISNLSVQKTEMDINPVIPGSSSWQPREMNPSFISSRPAVPLNLPYRVVEGRSAIFSERSSVVDTSAENIRANIAADYTTHNSFRSFHSPDQAVVPGISQNDVSVAAGDRVNDSGVSTVQNENSENRKEAESLKEEFPPSPSDHQSILVFLSSRSVWKGTVCERSHLFRIKYYGSFDKPLGRFLRDHLFDESYRCRSCEMPSEAHVHCYTHRQGSLTISVKKLPDDLLPGEKEGKIWMWHRCLRCPRVNGFPPATRRVVMSDAAWGLSFGKFLELSFSNHAAASRVACCGHSLHRDCLRFYGFGNMVACFRYATIDVHSVYLPPSTLSFNYENQAWIQRETDEVVERAELVFSEVLNTISQIAGKGLKESRRRIGELEAALQREKADFEENMQKILNREVKEGQPLVDVLELYRIRRQLLFQSYMWDHRLINAAALDNLETGIDTEREEHEKPMINSFNSLLAGSEPHRNPNGEFQANTNSLDTVLKSSDTSLDLNQEKEDRGELSSCKTLPDGSDTLKRKLDVRRSQSEGQLAMKNLSATLEAAWIGEHRAAVEIPKDNNFTPPATVLSDSSTLPSKVEGLKLMDLTEQLSELKVARPVSPALPGKNYEHTEDSVSWLGMSFFNFYRSMNKNFLASTQKLDPLGKYRPVYTSSFRESELQGGPRLLLPVGINDIVVPVHDDEPTSIIAYALMSPEYHRQISGEGESLVSYPSELNLSRSIDDTIFDPSRSLSSVDESILAMSTSRSSLLLDPLSYTKALLVRVSFGEDGTLGKVKYTVTCYYAKRFEALRSMCIPSELDYVRSLSRCKKWGAQGGKSNVFFAKTLDDRFIIKQVTKTELESFIKFAPAYFKYLSDSINTKSPTCLAKILGIYQVMVKQLKSGKETKMDVLVMENILFGRTVKRLYDLKGSSRARYNPDSTGINKVLLDQNLIEAMPTSPIFLGNKAKRLLERAVWNDTAFLALVDVMDYSLLVGVDEENHELVLGIIDFLRQYTWDKHLETWVKASGILGGSKNDSPTVISPKQYKKRFRKAMTTYFLMVPDQWSPSGIVPNRSQSDLLEENSRTGMAAAE
ncbi:PREDICTED: 1-phosphatidylinositol-3-phosphate 5-kinase FAB1B-like [Tarenaya hassleriana]|uniref:1-phosphatidylinositol-3-phosphate 5-kinase FAB1B-like n=1 Tax=Tarenaya hassleriana TaxID=28532 RepID=UPI00053C88C0|nr:PREDICTED: 1-phosphatidylinositol-3-phosphate 5-kinase FAB1B-like [Tarenaya hassleriana]